MAKKIQKKQIEMIGKVSNASVLKGSGKSWSAWIEILDRAGAGGWTHQETVAWIQKKHKLGPWWNQGVAYGYQVHKGLRIEGMSLKGEYSVTATKTLHFSKKKVWNALTSAQGLAVWLNPLSDFEFVPKAQYEVDGGIFGEIRTLKSPERARLTWQDSDWPKPTILQVYIFGQGDKKSGVALMHGGFKTIAQREQMRAHWKTALQRFSEFMNHEEK